jgi:hypothetical protein
MGKGEFWTLFLDLEKDIRELIIKSLLPVGFVDLLATARNSNGKDFDEWARIFQRMSELRLVKGKLMLDRNVGKATVIFFMHNHFIDEVIHDSDWQRKANQGLTWTRSSLQSESNKIDAANKEVIIDYIDNSGAVSAEQVFEKLSFFLSFRPFNEEFQNYDSMTDIVKRYAISGYDMEYLKRLYSMGRKEVNTKKRKERIQQVVSDFLQKNGIVKLDALTTAFSKKGVSENEVISVLRATGEHYFMSGFTRKSTGGPSFHKDWSLLETGDKIEISKSGKPVNLAKFLRDNDDVLTVLLKDQCLPEIRLVQWGVGYGDKNKVIYVILKNAVREILNDIVQKDKTGEDSGSYFQLLFFMALLHDVKKEMQIKKQKAEAAGDSGGETDSVSVLGFGSSEQFYDLYMMLHEMITAREDIMIKRKKLNLWRSVEKQSFLMSLLKIFSMSPSRKIEKQLARSKQNVKGMLRKFQSSGSVKRSNMDIVIDSIANTVTASLNPLQIVTLKNKLEGDPEACLKYVSGGLARYLKAALEQESTRTKFINGMLRKLTQIQSE